MVENLEENSRMLTRVDERTLHIQGSIKQLSEIVSNEYVTKTEFAPVKSIVYGMVGFLLLTCLGAAFALVMKK